MSRLRVLLVAFTVTAVVLGTMGTAFAAGTAYSDVAADSSISGAVARLNALEILKGYPDGTFKPDNPITRAEFAAVAVRAAGLSAAASATAGQTRFSDVPAGHWAVGYINAATTAGLLMGYPDGTFKPDQQVTQAEALTILVRALGYGPVVKGEWPNNYVNQASALGLTDGVSVSANLPATRGVVAQFVDNTLETETLVQRGFGDLAFYEPSGKIFAQDKLGLKVWNRSEARVTANARIDSSLDPGEVTVTMESGDPDIEDDFREIFGSLAPDFKLGAGLNSEEILGTEIEFWAKGNTIVYAQVITPTKRIITGYLDEDNQADGTPVKGTEKDDIWWIDEEDYKVAPGASLHFQNDTDLDGLTDIKDSDGAVVRAVLNDNDEIAFADVWKWDHVVVVKDVDGEDSAIEGPDLKAKWDDERVEFDDPTTLEGADLDVNSIKPGDIVYVIGDDYAVVKKPATGELESVSDKGDEVTIAGKDYDTNARAGFSVDGNDSADYVSDGSNAAEDLLDLVGQDVSYYLDVTGDVLFVSGEVTTTSTATEALAIDADKVGSRWVITFLTEDGKLVDYDATSDTSYEDDDDKLSESTVESIIKGVSGSSGNFALVEFTLTDDGDLDTVTLLDYHVDDTDKRGFSAASYVNENDDFDEDVRTIKVGDSDKAITVPKSIKVYDLIEEDVFTGEELVNAKLGKIDADGDAGTNVELAWTVSSGSVAETVVVWQAQSGDNMKIAYGFAEENTGIVVARKFSSTGNKVTLVLPGGEKQEYGVDRDDLRSMALGTVISFDVDKNGNITDWDREVKSPTDKVLHGADTDANVIYSDQYDVTEKVYEGFTLDDDVVIVDAEDDYATVRLTSVVEDADNVDPDFENYKFDLVDVDEDGVYDYVILHE